MATGWLPWHDAVDTTGRVAPILLFLASITVVAELAARAEVFEVAAGHAARLGQGSTPRLYAWVLVLGAATTTVLSLDTTAVLLTPVVLALALRLGLPPLPFAMAAVWLANTASLLLPVSNLTNLFAISKLHLSALEFAGRMWLPALGALAVTAGVLGVTYRRQLTGRYEIPPRLQVRDVVLFRWCAGVCLLVGPLFVAGLPVPAVAFAAAIALTVVFAVRHRSSLQVHLIPWRLVLLVEGLFLTVATLSAHGLTSVLADAAGSSQSLLGVLRIAGVGAAASNAVNNLPAYLALEPVTAGRHDQLLGLLLGTNVGPLVLLWGSLATLLWRDRCRAQGVQVGAGHFARVGAVGVPLLLLVTVAALWTTR